MKLNFETNIAEGTPEELVEYLRLVEEGEKKSGVEDEDTASTELKVGDKVKVLKSLYGAEGEATVTKVLEEGNVLIAGTSNYGTYLPNWSNHVMNLEKIEEEEDEDVEPEEADELLGYRYWYLDSTASNNNIVLKTTNSYLEDSTGRRYTYQAVSGYVKPIDREDVGVKFDEAENRGVKLRYYPSAKNVFVL